MQNVKKPMKTPVGWALSALVGAVLLALLWPGFRAMAFGPVAFMPHRTCYLNDPGLIWLHVISDTSIGLAYVSISLTLAYLVKKANVPFHLAFLAFGAFIGACGMTHFMEVWTVWEPRYWLAGMVKVVTAVASVVTALWLFPLLPRAFALVRSTEVAEEHRIKLAAAHEQLEATHQKLTTAHQQLQTMYDKMTELDALKTAFFSNVSHELRTPLALILGPTRQVLETASLSGDDRRRLETVERNASLLLNHVNDLLDLSKMDARKMAVDYVNVDLATLTKACAGYFDSLATERTIAFQVHAPEKLRAQADADKLQRVLFNLLSNAFKFTPSGGRIVCRLSTQNDQAIFEVQDSGPGIPAEMRTTVFERFRQLDSGLARRAGGTGLGLSIVKEFVEIQQGTVSIEETPGGGATFKVGIPLKAPEGAVVKNSDSGLDSQRAQVSSGTLVALRQQQSDHRPEPAAPSKSHERPLVLVVEDNRDMNLFIADTLASDYRIGSAYDGKEGLEKALKLLPDLIICDIMMPEMSGDQLVQAVRARPETKDIPIIILSAKADDELRAQLLHHGAQDYVMKPPMIDELRARVANAISLKKSRDILQQQLAMSGGKLEELAEALSMRERETEKARAAAEAASRAKDEFLMTLSHELRTPLTPILGWTRLLRGGPMNEVASAKALEVIERNTRTEMKLIEDLLDISRVISGKLKIESIPFALVPCIESTMDAIRPAADAKSIAMTFAMDPSDYRILGDPMRLQQVVWNLLNNAVKFTPKEGKIEIRLVREEALARIVVSDNGEGIDPAFLPHLFTKFSQADSSSTRRHGGLGIGLSIVRELVGLHGGEVRAESAGIGQGATFVVTLPLLKTSGSVIDSRKISRIGPVMRQDSHLKGLRVLVVDDELDAREFLSVLLERYGAVTAVAASASEALDTLTQFHPHVLLSDIAMPNEDGYALLRKLRERGVNVPAIAVTAYARAEDREQAHSMGYQMHFGKPVDPAEIVAAVSQFVPNA